MKINDPRFIIAYTIILLFTGAYVYHPDETMTGALIAAFAGAWGYFLGSSSGAAKANDNAGKALDVAGQTATAAATAATLASGVTAPTTILEPGETAQAAPAPITNEGG